MKFKYYLRGAGIGIIVSAVILMIAFSKYNKKLTDDDIIERAKELGMVMDDSSQQEDDEPDSTKPSDNKDGENNDDQGDGDNTEDGDADDKTGDNGDDGGSDDNDGNENRELVWFQIKNGEFSDVISNHLYEKGLIDDPVKYNEWLMKNGYDMDLVTGTFMIPKNSTYEEIAKILTSTDN